MDGPSGEGEARSGTLDHLHEAQQHLLADELELRPLACLEPEVRPLQQSDLFEELRTAVAVPALTNSPGASAAGVEGGVPESRAA